MTNKAKRNMTQKSRRRDSRRRSRQGRSRSRSRRRDSKSGRSITKLPKLRPISYASKKYHYKLSDPAKKRRRAIREGIRYEVKQGKSEVEAATAKKSRFNILRIYRRYSFPDQCRLITEDMKYIDKKYKLNNTNDICS